MLTLRIRHVLPVVLTNSTASLAAVSCRARSCSWAASPGSANRRCCCRRRREWLTQFGPVLYASGEESEHQIKARGDRLGIGDAPLYLLAETCLERILDEVRRLNPALLIVDSIQTMFSLKLQSAPGSIGQVREAATHLLFTAKGANLPIFLVGHITKDGSLAGPKALEHIVDTVLYFEGERHHSHRVVRAVKNRFGAVSELGVFEMAGDGLHAVPNPSRLFLSERASTVPGSAVLCSIEGSRPILLEVQALVSTGNYGTARRTASGIDHSRLSLLLAVLEKRAGLAVAGDDVFVNIAGGLIVTEPAAILESSPPWLPVCGTDRFGRGLPCLARWASLARFGAQLEPRFVSRKRRSWALRGV